MSGGALAKEFDALQLGESFITRGRTVTEADIVAFASLTGDWHPQHSDAAWAEQSQFGERIAHGLLVVSYAAGLAPVEPALVVALRGIQDVSFKRPVLIGDTIHVVVRVAEKKPLDAEHGLVSLVWEIRNQRDKLVARARLSLIWRRGEGTS